MPLLLETLNRAELGAFYCDTVGYNPFEDCPSLTDSEVRQTLREYFAEGERAVAAAKARVIVSRETVTPAEADEGATAKAITCVVCTLSDGSRGYYEEWGSFRFYCICYNRETVATTRADVESFLLENL